MALGMPVMARTSDVTALKTQGPRTPGWVPRSLQYEINAAVDRGHAWLVATQNPNGGWGSNTSIRLTAIATLGLTQDAAPDEQAAIAKAAQWLTSPASSNAVDVADPEAHAWRILALQIIHNANFVSFAFPPLPAITNATPVTRILLHGIRNLPVGGTAPSAAATNTLLQLASCWSAENIPRAPGISAARQYWIWARFINAVGGGSLADGQGRLLDWRNDLAR